MKRLHPPKRGHRGLVGLIEGGEHKTFVVDKAGALCMWLGLGGVEDIEDKYGKLLKYLYNTLVKQSYISMYRSTTIIVPEQVVNVCAR